MIPRRPPRRVLAPALAVLGCVAIVAGCMPPVPAPASPAPTASVPVASHLASPSPSPSAAGSPTATADAAATYAQIERQVVAIRGLQPKATVDPKVLDPEQLKVHVATEFTKDNPPAVVGANERLLKGLGLFPKDASLADLYVKLLGSQVAGFYSPDDKALYVVSRSGAVGPVERVTFAHEYTHALQDQNFNLKSFDLGAVGQGDRGQARLSLIEGDAVTVQTQWTTANLTSAEAMQLFQAALDPEALKILEGMPPILRESLEFPYDAGLRFVMRLQGRGGFAAVDKAFANPPASTEQILHPEKYDSGEAPVTVSIPNDLATRMGAGWKSSLEDTLGEFELAVWLRGGTDRIAVANTAAAGWGGDRVELLDGPNGAWAIALVTEWDTAADATEFADAAGAVATKLEAATVGTQPGSKRVTVLIGSDPAVAAQLDALMGNTGA